MNNTPKWQLWLLQHLPRPVAIILMALPVALFFMAFAILFVALLAGGYHLLMFLLSICGLELVFAGGFVLVVMVMGWMMAVQEFDKTFPALKPKDDEPTDK